MNEEIRKGREELILKTQNKMAELEPDSAEFERLSKTLDTLSETLNNDIRTDNEARKLQSVIAEEEIPTTFWGKTKRAFGIGLNAVVQTAKFMAPIIVPVAGTVFVKCMDCDQHERDNEHERGLARDCMDFENEKTFTTLPSKKLIFKNRR